MAPTELRGNDAVAPREIPARGWKQILWRVKDEIIDDHVSVVAAGVAFFGLLALFPALAAVISIAGFFLDPATVAQQIDTVAAMLPQNAAAIIQDQLAEITKGSDAATGLAAIFGLLLAIYGAMKGVKTLMEGMNIAYDEDETRSFLWLNLTAAALTLCLIAVFLAAVGVSLVLPAITAAFGLGQGVETAIAWLKWPILALVAMVGLAILYRYGPSRDAPRWRWVWETYGSTRHSTSRCEPESSSFLRRPRSSRA